MAELPDTLIVIPGSDLPAQGWSSKYGTALDRDLFVWPTRAAPNIGPITRSQPHNGGLYTSSLIYVGDELLGSHWTEGNPISDHGDMFYLVHPKSDAKVLIIDGEADLVAAIDRWPHRNPMYHGNRSASRYFRALCSTVDWPAAAREIDAVWLTVRGNNVLHINEPGLYTWDTEQVLWLTPAFVVGKRVHLLQGDPRTDLQQRWHQTLMNQSFADMLRDPDSDGDELRAWLASTCRSTTATYRDYPPSVSDDKTPAVTGDDETKYPVRDDDPTLQLLYVSDPSLLRPDTPDMARLIDCVAQMELLKASGMSATQAYADVVDVMSVSYLAVQRTGMNMDQLVLMIEALFGVPQQARALLLRAIRELTSNSWVEGFAYGVTFERKGGHRPNSD